MILDKSAELPELKKLDVDWASRLLLNANFS